MARVTLVSPYPNPTAFGLRTISSHLKAHGHLVDLVLLPDSTLKASPDAPSARYPDLAHEDLAGLCAKSDLVGISVMTNYFDCAVEVTQRLKRDVGSTVIWGGIHPTVRPAECLAHADMVCVGEGEETTLQVANRIDDGGDTAGVPNLLTDSAPSLTTPPVSAALDDLDSVPPPDLGLDRHFLLHDGRIRPLTSTLLEAALVRFGPKDVPGYQTMTGRGCPHKCTYCANRTLRNLFCGRRYLRWRSTDHVMAEFRQVASVAPSVGFVWLADDAFFARTPKNLREFCDQYKRTVGLPFSCLASPLTVTEEKLEILLDAGMVQVQMGVESGSARMQSFYDRRGMSNRVILRAAGRINRFAHRMYPPHYDFIIDNPYERSEDRSETLALISRLPKPYRLNTFSLVLYPGTDLHELASRDGLITDEIREVYSRKTWGTEKYGFFNLMMSLASGGRVPSWLLRFLALPWVGKSLGHRLLDPVYRTLRFVRRVLGGGVARLRRIVKRVKGAPTSRRGRARATS